jgi:hypothetical protein
MKYKRIGHQKTFNPFEFVYEKIELTEDFPVDKPDEDCIKELSSRIEAMARTIYPNLYEQEKPFVNSLATKAFINAYSEPERFEPPEPEQKPLLQLIQESDSVAELKSWNVLIAVEKDNDTRKNLRDTYDKRMKLLTKKESV